MPPTTPQQQSAERIIRHKKTQYIQWVDAKQLDLLPQLFHQDASFLFVDRAGATVKTAGLEWKFENGAAFVGFLKGLRAVQTVHLIDAGLFEHVSADEVRVVWTVMFNSGPADDVSGKGHRSGGGHYHETWRRVGGGDEGEWLLASMKLQTLYERASSL